MSPAHGHCVTARGGLNPPRKLLRFELRCGSQDFHRVVSLRRWPTRRAAQVGAQLLYEAVMVTAEEVIEQLGLLPHPEGGFYAETFRAAALPFGLPGRGQRSASTAIYFLLRAQDFSALHEVSSDEVWHHYLGDTLELHCFDDLGRHREVRLGAAITAGERPQHVVLRGELQAARVTAGPHGFALCGCTVAPGFDFADFRMPGRAELLARLPEHTQLVTALTRV